MRLLKGFIYLLVVMTVLFASGFGYAKSKSETKPPAFGLGHPLSAQHIPAGKLRNRLESLPPQARSKALRWLQDFSFPETDLENIRVDENGSVLYLDTLLPDPDRAEAPGDPGAEVESAPIETLDAAFELHSNPGSPNVVFIDFDGAIISGTAWNGGGSSIVAVPYNVEGSASSFSTLERTRIVDIWHRVSEDLAPFDIDVTTEEPASFDSHTGHILVTHSLDAYGDPIYCTSCGGVAYVNVFGRSTPPYNYAYYSPALVFFDKLGNGNETYTSEASSHEFGHNLGLSHDGTKSGTTYYRGQGSGLVSWAPIMGNSYYNNVTEFSKGEYPDANQTQDDLGIIENKLGYLADDHGNSAATASALSVDPSGSVVSSNPELDPHNLLTENKGVIGSSSDVDVFSFTAGAGTVDLTINPAWDAFYRSSTRRGANLDVEAELRTSGGTSLVTVDPENNTNATINTEVAPGTYYLFITGVGNSPSNYSDYDSLGHYFINGSVPQGTPDETAPTPDPMTWASVPQAGSSTEISMTATTAVDETSSVEYRFLCIAGDSACSHSSWQANSSYSATGLTPGMTYQYQVVARDQSLNETTSSESASATTDTPPSDVITLISAVYKPDRGEFKVRATSSAQPDVSLDVVGFGNMTFKNGKYEYKLKPVGNTPIPQTVDIVSSLGAILTVDVVGAPPPPPDPVPGKATVPDPGNGVSEVSISTTLDWAAGADTDSHKVYFGTDSNPASMGNQTATGFDPGPLANSTIYYWRIDEVNTFGTTTGDLWSFTTVGIPQPPGQASNPSPSNDATSVDVNTGLDWTSGSQADSHNVYFGTSANPPQISAGQAGTSYDPGELDELTEYFWRVDEVNAQGTTIGPDWSFTTGDATPADTIVISKAEWKASTDELKVEATTTGAPGTVLTVVGYGQMSYDSRKNKYKFQHKPVGGNPGTVTVTSSLGGSATKSVRQR